MNDTPEQGRTNRRMLTARRTSLGSMATSKPQETISLDAPPVWDDKPQTPNQLAKKGMFKLDRVEVKIFDLNDVQQLKEYSELLTKANAEDTNMILMANERTFCRGTQNWKALVQIQYVKFRQILQKKKLEEVPEERSQAV